MYKYMIKKVWLIQLIDFQDNFNKMKSENIKLS